MNYQAAIFDMDGLLLDTERVCMRIFKQACEVQNLPFHEDVYLSIIGRNAAGIEVIFRKAYGEDLDRLHKEWRTRYNAVVQHQAIPVKQGVIELLEWLKKNGIPTAVATSTANEVAKKKLELAGLSKYFDNLTTGCEVTHGKPDPEIYLLAASRLNVDPTKCLAFEDSNNGVRSAVSAKMITFQIPDLVEPCDEVRGFGHAIVPSLHHVLAELKLA
ncbi:HAD family phosphatase [Vibrio rotiferianus]|mgnify:FL=1|jgi:HAD superfamily hydrolase (TIGR01509 family)|uniref:HAD family hydrolase n=1 Tax=Vibrio TaxID=662 RepID=UPI0002377D8C|nr:HAD family phosphatase [Vibrio rotiferianus]ASI94676.1 phosphatase [Vibrio rotiferianus]PIB12805.1 phosphoglycolate phosphatase [Vibrio rotiferianus CAIM 577 = LMG 21460]TMX39316.1 HAD family phosphatase [Vibrio rotiferianus]TMX50519.1 HAD family phosphatase [Vibrio rotiferianus]TMX68090.1 HAD family phosphatase [Vibrio rotiferianus]